MPSSRRSFLTTVGAGSLAMIGSGCAARGARAVSPAVAPGDARPDRAVIRLGANENPHGPGDAALRAIRSALPEANRYAFTAMSETAEAIAAHVGVPADHVTLGCGSSEILEAAVSAYTSTGRHLVTSSPTFELPAERAGRVGAPIRTVRIDARGRLDLDGMIDVAPGAGLLYVCNPNNPTSTVHGASDVRTFIERVHARNPDAVVLVDEAYHEYVDEPSYATAVPLVMSDPLVLVTRTFSKIHGMAGLRVGYVIGQPGAVRRLRPWLGGLTMSVLTAAAGRASLADTAHIEEQRALNRTARAFLVEALRRDGCAVFASDANFVMADVGRDSRSFALACAARGVRIARAFPPLTNYARITVGTMDETRQAATVFTEVLATPPGVTAAWPHPSWADEAVRVC